jgi:hypothetical protein
MVALHPLVHQVDQAQVVLQELQDLVVLLVLLEHQVHLEQMEQLVLKDQQALKE